MSCLTRSLALSLSLSSSVRIFTRLAIACADTSYSRGDPYVAVELSYFTLYAETSLSHLVSSLNDDSLNNIRYTSIANRSRLFRYTPEAINLEMDTIIFHTTKKRFHIFAYLILISWWKN